VEPLENFWWHSLYVIPSGSLGLPGGFAFTLSHILVLVEIDL